MNLDDIIMLRDSSTANVDPIIKLRLGTTIYSIIEDSYYIDDDGDLYFEIEPTHQLRLEVI